MFRSNGILREISERDKLIIVFRLNELRIYWGEEKWKGNIEKGYIIFVGYWFYCEVFSIIV